MFTSASIPTVENFLKACGSHVEELDVKGLVNFAEVFENVPNLRKVLWDPQSMHSSHSLILDTAFNSSAGHENLEQLTLQRVPDSRGSEKEHTRLITTFFNSLDLAKFPSLKQIQFAAYKWPIEERAISKDIMPNKAIQVKEKYGIDIIDRSGKPWRQRVQKRR